MFTHNPSNDGRVTPTSSPEYTARRVDCPRCFGRCLEVHVAALGVCVFVFFSHLRVDRRARRTDSMPKRTFIPNLLRYKRKHGFLARLKFAKHIIRGWRKDNMEKKLPTIYGPFPTFGQRRVYEYKQPYSLMDATEEEDKK